MKINFFRIITFLFLFVSVSLTAQETAYPKDGDGVFSFLRRHDRVGNPYVKEFKALNTGKLNAKGELIMGRKYILPPLVKNDKSPASEPKSKPSSSAKTTNKGTNPSIFGKNFSDIKPQSDRLKNACFYIISGHGGPDPGAIARLDKRTLHEDEYAYDIALRLARNLMMDGATVHVIIQDPKDGIRDEMYLNNSSNETCMGKAIPLNQLERLKQRVNKVNELYNRDKAKYNYIRAIDIHVDSRNKGKRIDVFFYHSNNKYSKSLAITMRNVFREKYDIHQPSRGFGGFVEHRNLYILRQLKPSSILVETGNIQNEFDRRRLLSSDNRQALANWMAQAFYDEYRKSSR